MTNQEINFLTCTYESMRDCDERVVEFCRMIMLAFPTIEKAGKTNKTIEKLAKHLYFVCYSLVTSNDFEKKLSKVSERTDLQVSNAIALMFRITTEV